MLHHDRTSIAVTWWLGVVFPYYWGYRDVGVGNIEGWGREEWGKQSNGDMGGARKVHCSVKSFIFTWNISEWTTFSCWNLKWRCLSKPLLGKSSQVTPALGWDLRSCRHVRSQSLGRSQTSSDELVSGLQSSVTSAVVVVEIAERHGELFDPCELFDVNPMVHPKPKPKPKP